MKEYGKILLSHGSGGRLSRSLIQEEILSRFGDGPLKSLPDAATLACSCSQLAFSTDSFVVQPLVFPGGNIGDLAVYGTVNDLSVSGARPLWLSLSLILEEGLEVETLRVILDSVKSAALKCNVQIVTGDTKVVRRGQCDGIYINTAGIGEIMPGFDLSPTKIKEEDSVIVSGPIGDHGMAVMSAREGIVLGEGPISDTDTVHRLVQGLADYASFIRVMRDPTRGGASAVLNELIEETKLNVLLSEESIPINGPTRAVAEVLGIDLLQVACEGRLIAICDSEVAWDVVNVWRAFPEGKGASVIAKIVNGTGLVILETLAGGKRLVDIPEGELLPRIC